MKIRKEPWWYVPICSLENIYLWLVVITVAFVLIGGIADFIAKDN